jgi:hypothetical protein
LNEEIMIRTMSALALFLISAPHIAAAESGPFADATYTISSDVAPDATARLSFKDGVCTDERGLKASVAITPAGDHTDYMMSFSEVKRDESGIGMALIDKSMASMGGNWASASGRSGPPTGSKVTYTYAGSVTGDTIVGTVSSKIGNIPQADRWAFQGKRTGPWTALSAKRPVKWMYTLTGTGTSAALDTDGFTAVFSGIPAGLGGGTGTLTLSGPGTGGGSTGSGADKFSDEYKDGVCTISYRGNKLLVTDEGRLLSVNGKEFKLSDGKPTIVIQKDGKATQKSLAKPGPKLALDGKEFHIDIASSVGSGQDHLSFAAGKLHFETMGMMMMPRTAYKTVKQGAKTAFSCAASGMCLDSPITLTVGGVVDGDNISGKGSFIKDGAPFAEFTFTGTAYMP